MSGRRLLRIALLTLGALAPTVARAQEVISFEALLERVVATHPIARQAELARRQVAAEALGARGAFDPVLSATWDVKRFRGIGYYDEFDTRLTAPTPWGVDLMLGWERAAGQIINPERATPGEGLLSLGISLPIGPQLLTDRRRTSLRQAELADEVADAERAGAIAQLTDVVARDYGSWVEAHARRRIAADGEALARFRLTAVRARVEAGDAAAIDTVEAALELERRIVQRLEAEAAEAVARLALSAHLWTEDGRPDSLRAAAEPAAVRLPEWVADSARADAFAARVLPMHPAVQASTARWLRADAQRRLSAVELLPSASVEISGLAAGRSIGEVPTPGVAGDDYKAGAALRVPLFARRERARLRVAEDRTRQLALERDRVRRVVEVQLARALLELRLLGEQLARQRRVTAGAEALLQAELRRFDAGESSLLLVNLRERSVLDERLKLAQLDARRAQALGGLAAAAGTRELPLTPPT